MVGGVFHTYALFLLLLFAVATGHHRQKWISRITLVGTANERLRHAWGTLIDKIDRLIRGTKSAGRNARLSALRRASEAFLFTHERQKEMGLACSHEFDENWTRLGRFTRLSWMEESYYYSSAEVLCRDGRMDGNVLVIPQMHSTREYGPWENRFYDESSPGRHVQSY